MEFFGFNISKKAIEVDSISFKNVSEALKYRESGLEVDYQEMDLDSKMHWSASGRLLIYRRNGFAKNIVNSVADDSTREGFNIVLKDDKAEVSEQVNVLIQKRLKELNYKRKLRNAIKFSRIHSEGSGLFFGILAAKSESLKSINLSETIPEKIEKLEFVNTLDSPDFFTYRFDNQSDPTKKNYAVPTFQINGQEINAQRMSFLVTELDIDTQDGISIIDLITDPIAAEESGIHGAAHILQRVGALLLKSEGLQLQENTPKNITKLVQFMKSEIKSHGAMALLKDDDLKMLSHSFSGMKEVYNFILEDMAGRSGLPVSKIVGTKKAGIISGSDDDLINYFMDTEAYQENTLQPEARKVVDLLFREESNDALKKITKGKVPIYDIEYNPLFSLSQKEMAENRKKNSEADKIDFDVGKSTGSELRTLDPRYSDLDDIVSPPDDDSGDDT